VACGSPGAEPPTSAAAAAGAAPAAAEEAPALTGTPVSPDRDPFYTPPEPPTGRPGDVVRYRRFVLHLDKAGKVEAPVRLWQVLYRSTDAQDEPVTVSGTLGVPLTPWNGDGDRPIIGYGPVTHGLADRCAPSYRVARGTEHGLGDAVQALSRGWAVAMTDYDGLGTPGDHTYGVHRAEGRAVLDMLRAATRIPDAGLSADARMALWGYSQGGAAVASAAEQAATYAPELELAGVAAGGVPADLRVLTERLDGTQAFGLVFAGLVGFNAAYPELGLPEKLTPTARRLLERARKACDADLIAADFRSHRMTEIGGGTDPLDNRATLARLTQNRVGGTAPDMPVRIYQGGNDEFIPATIARTLFADYCRRDVVVQFQLFPGRNHLAGAADGQKGTLNWLADRLAGKPAPDSCGAR
jgi:hypothetical protein